MGIFDKKKDENTDMSRQALIWMHPEALLRFMTSKRWVIQENTLPEDAKFHHSFFDPQRQVFGIVVSSKEFKQVKLGEPLPELDPITFRFWNSSDGEIK